MTRDWRVSQSVQKDSLAQFGSAAMRRLCVVVWLGLPLVLSCNWGSPPSGGASGADAPAGARDVIDRMLKAYHEASSYADSGQLLVRYDRENGERISEDVDASVTFARPNKLRMHFYQAIVVSDGKDLRQRARSAQPGFVGPDAAEAEL